MRVIIIACIGLCTAFSLSGQSVILDKVVAKVGNEFVLHSEVQQKINFWKEKAEVVPDDAKCTILEEALVANLLVHSARIDSVEVPDADVEARMDRQINEILAMMGNDVSQFEAYYGQTITQAKEYVRNDLRKKMNAEKMQSIIIDGIKATPAEVIKYFNRIPKDSLPFFNSEVELGEIIYKPVVNDSQRTIALEKIQIIADSLANGGNFEDLARRYSDDTGSGQQGGSLGRSPRGTFVQEFEAAAYQLEQGEISEIVETEFGFHLIRLDGRYGDVVDVSHILISPAITEADLKRAEEHLMGIREQIMTDSLLFVDAVRLYSNKNAQSYSNGGRVVNQNTGNTFFETGELDPDIFFAIDTVDLGDITMPLAFRSVRGEVVYKLIQLQSRTAPHQASLQKDYAKIQEAARQSKRNDAFNEWIEKRIGNTYILLDDHYAGCPNLERWQVYVMKS